MGGGGGVNVIPAPMGMMMLGTLIMQLTGDPPGINGGSWDVTSLMMGMGGMMGGMGGGMGGMGGGMGGMGGGMGGMGGGMGGMGMGGMGGGMGGGFRSVPPTMPPHAALEPGQTRQLPTKVVSLNPPAADGKVVLPRKGEKLRLGEAGQSLSDARLRAALVRLASAKAPETVSQLVLWQLGTGLDWATLGRLSKGWANGHELALARGIVERLDVADAGRESREAAFDSGVVYLDVQGSDEAGRGRAESLRQELSRAKTMLGLTVRTGVPARPSEPSLAARVTFQEDGATVQVATTDAHGSSWTSAGKFALALDGEAVAWADRLAEGILSRVARAQLVKGPKVKGSDTYRIRIENGSPFVLSGLALAGLDWGQAAIGGVAANEGAEAVDAEVTELRQVPSILAGVALPPRKSFTMGASADFVERMGLKTGIKLLAADLNGL
jgi:hypothetical protein